MEKIKNIVIFGESGDGKSSTVNLLLGKEVAAVSDRAIGCTFEFQKFDAGTYFLYDTVGLSEGKMGTVDQSLAVNKLINLLKSLAGGVSLLIFVMQKGKIKKSLDQNYKLFVEAICMNHVPVVLVITHCEMEIQPGKWWNENKKHFDKYGMNFSAVVSGCSMTPKTAPVPTQSLISYLNQSTVSQLHREIQNNMLVQGWKVVGGWKNWVQTCLKAILKVLFGSKYLQAWFGFEETNFQDRIRAYFLNQGYDVDVAKKMADDIANAV